MNNKPRAANHKWNNQFYNSHLKPGWKRCVHCGMFRIVIKGRSYFSLDGKTLSYDHAPVCERP